MGQSVSPSERIVQHLEEANDPDRFAHPKKLRITELLAAGAVPEMWVFDRLPGTEDAENDPVDVMEQIWIGYFVHQRGQTANVDDIPPAPRGKRMLTKVGLTVADLDQQFASYATRQDPAQERVQLQRAPKITASPVPDPNVPPSVLGNKAANWLPDQAAWDWYQRNLEPSHAAYQPGIDWAETQWGLPGVGSAKRDDLWSAGITTWDQVANPTPAEQAALLKIAENNPNTVAEWMGKAQYTLGVNAGYLPPLYRDDKAKAPLPPQQFATGPQGFEYSRPAEGAVYPGQQRHRCASQPEPDRHQRRAEQCADSTADWNRAGHGHCRTDCCYTTQRNHTPYCHAPLSASVPPAPALPPTSWPASRSARCSRWPQRTSEQPRLDGSGPAQKALPAGAAAHAHPAAVLRHAARAGLGSRRRHRRGDRRQLAAAHGQRRLCLGQPTQTAGAPNEPTRHANADTPAPSRPARGAAQSAPGEPVLVLPRLSPQRRAGPAVLAAQAAQRPAVLGRRQHGGQRGGVPRPGLREQPAVRPRQPADLARPHDRVLRSPPARAAARLSARKGPTWATARAPATTSSAPSAPAAAPWAPTPTA